MKHSQWPALPYEAWKDTYETLHMWMQIVGKIRLARMPWLNHCWQVTFYPTARGLTTGPMPYGEEHLQLDFDFIEPVVLEDSERRHSFPLHSMSVAEFHSAVIEMLSQARHPVHFNGTPNEIEPAIVADERTGGDHLRHVEAGTEP